MFKVHVTVAKDKRDRNTQGMLLFVVHWQKIPISKTPHLHETEGIRSQD